MKIPSSFTSNEHGDSLYLNDTRIEGGILDEFGSGSALLVFQGNKHWWAVSEQHGIYREDAVQDRDSPEAPDDLLLRLNGTLPEDNVLADTILEGVDMEGVTAVRAPVARDPERVRYDDLENPEIGRSEHEPWSEREAIEGCSYD